MFNCRINRYSIFQSTIAFNGATVLHYFTHIELTALVAVPEEVATSHTGGDVPHSIHLGGGGSPGEPHTHTLVQGVTAPLLGCRGESGDGNPRCRCAGGGVGGRGGECWGAGGGEEGCGGGGGGVGHCYRCHCCGWWCWWWSRSWCRGGCRGELLLVQGCSLPPSLSLCWSSVTRAAALARSRVKRLRGVMVTRP